MITIFNLHFTKPEGPTDFVIGRPSPLGNPFTVQKYGRETAIEKYKSWLWEKMKTDTPQKRMLDRMLAAYRQYGVLNLFCWCSPRPCHATIVKAAIVWLNGIVDPPEADEIEF